MEKKLKYSTGIIPVLFAVLFIFGAILGNSYGQPLDEQFETAIMLSNIKEYVVLLPDSSIKNKLMHVQAIESILPISQNEEKDHGEAAYYPYVFLYLVARKVGINSMYVMHFYTFVLFFAGVLSLYFIGKRVFDNKWIAMFLALCLYFSPRMFADGHYNNKDMVLLVFALVTILWGIKMIEKPAFLNATVFALSGAVATNTKIAGAWFFGVFGIYYLIRLILEKQLNKKTFLVGLTAIIVFFAGYVIITPAFLSGPVEFVNYLITSANDFTRWDNLILFRGRFYQGSVNPLPAWYLPYMILVTTPEFIVIGIVTGFIAVLTGLIKNIKKEERPYLRIITLLWVFPLIYAVASHTKLYNGWRHFYFIYGPMMVTAVYGLILWGGWIKKLVNKKNADKIIAVALLISIFLGVVLNHPYQMAYYNVLAGTKVEDNLELDYWDVSVMPLLKELKKKCGDADKITIGSCDNWTLAGIKKNLKVMEDDTFVMTDWKEADWVMINTTYAKLYPIEDTNYVMENYDIKYTAKSYGNVIMAIYEKTR